MSRPYITKVRIQNFGCINDVTLFPTPLHAIIGPNDSGKTTVLRALHLAVAFAQHVDHARPTDAPLVFWPSARPGFSLEYDFGMHSRYRLRESGGHPIGEITAGEGKPVPFMDRRLLPTELLGDPSIAAIENGARIIRFDPDELRRPSALVPEGGRLAFFNDRGYGLPGVYDRIINRSDDSLQKIVSTVRELFPTVDALRVNVVSGSLRALELSLKNGDRIPLEGFSEGLLYYLGFAALRYTDPVSLLLVEQPENGLHPARIHGVMKVLRDISQTVQVLVATHSPFVINEMQPDEVTVLTRTPEEGTRATLIKNTPNFEERSKVYALGELWVSYADGKLEEPLLTEPEPEPDAEITEVERKKPDGGNKEPSS